jgi:hypothetical protein
MTFGSLNFVYHLPTHVPNHSQAPHSVQHLVTQFCPRCCYVSRILSPSLMTREIRLLSYYHLQHAKRTLRLSYYTGILIRTGRNALHEVGVAWDRQLRQ